VRQPMALMAHAAVDLLVVPQRADPEAMRATELRSVLPYDIIVRDSTSAPRSGGRR